MTDLGTFQDDIIIEEDGVRVIIRFSVEGLRVSAQSITQVLNDAGEWETVVPDEDVPTNRF